MSYSKERLERVWDKGQDVEGKNPNLYREDIEGNLMYKYSYGKQSDMGWEVDHSKPKSKRGTDHLNNLQPMHWKENRRKGDKY